MTAPVDPRTWLAERGLAKAGTRGRFSTAANEALAAAREAGVRFLEKGQATATVVTLRDGEAVCVHYKHTATGKSSGGIKIF